MFLIALTLLVASAQAYFPPSFFILRQVARKQADLKNVTIKSRVTFTDGGTATETLHVADGRLALVIKNDDGKTIATAARALGEEVSSLPLLYGISLQRSSASLFTRLKSAGLPLKTESQLYAEKDENHPDLPYKPESTVGLSREGERAVLVLSPDGKTTHSLPALIVDKNSLLPLKALIRADSGETIEYRIEQHIVYQGSFYPRRIEVLKSGEPWARIDLVEIKPSTSSIANLANKIYDDAGGLAGALENYMRWVR